MRFFRKVFGYDIGAADDAGVFAKGPDAFGHGFRIQAIVVTELLGAKDAAKNDAVSQGKRPWQRARAASDVQDPVRPGGAEFPSAAASPSTNSAPCSTGTSSCR